MVKVIGSGRLLAVRLTFVGNGHEEVRRAHAAPMHATRCSVPRTPSKYAISGACFFNPWRNPRYPIQHGVGYDKTKKHTDELNGEARGKGRGGGKWVKGSAS